MGKRSGTTTIAEVASRAEVSLATVSRVMNGRFVGDPAIGDRLRAVAAELRYSPSPLARSLGLGRTHTVAFVVPDLADPAFQAVLTGLTRAAARRGPGRGPGVPPPRGGARVHRTSCRALSVRHGRCPRPGARPSGAPRVGARATAVAAPVISTGSGAPP